MTKMSVSLKLSHKNNNNDFCMAYNYYGCHIKIMVLNIMHMKCASITGSCESVNHFIL